MTESKFNSAPLSLREMILAKKVGDGDTEALAELMELRRLDKTWDVLALSGDELTSAITEMGEALAMGSALANVFSSFKSN